MPIPAHTLVQYIEVEGKKKAVLVATPLNDTQYGIGFSVCHSRDRFNKKRGLEIALGRAVKGTLTIVPIDMESLIEEYLSNFLKRCDSFYKGMVFYNTVEDKYDAALNSDFGQKESL